MNLGVFSMENVASLMPKAVFSLYTDNFLRKITKLKSNILLSRIHSVELVI